jgi:hypothetical protein
LFNILLVVDNEAVCAALCATLRRAGHRVTASTTIAGTVETLMRRGPSLDVIITSTRYGSSLGEDVIEYGRKFAASARMVVLRDVGGRIEDIEQALARQAVSERLSMTRGWN